MGKKVAGKQAKPHTNQEPKNLPKQKRQELHNLVEKLLKVTSISPEGPSVAKLWELHEESQTIIDRIQQIESDMKCHVNKHNRAVLTENFLAWMKQHGSDFDGIDLSEFSGFELGLKATKPITKGSHVLRIPKKLMLSAECCDNMDFKKLLFGDKMLTNMPNVALSFALIVERLNQESFFKPYLDVLPFTYNTVLYYESQDLQDMKGSPTLEMALKQCRSIRRQYAYFYKMIWTSSLPLFDRLREKWTYNLYCWSVSTVMTRQNSVPLVAGEPPAPALVPLWDMANHKDGHITTEFNIQEQCLECSSMEDYAPGEQIFIFYGERTNAELLVHNGFVYPDNPYDSLSIRLGISPSDPLFASKESVLAALSLPRGWDLPLARAPTPITPQLLGYVRVFNMNKEQLDYWAASERVTDLFHVDCALDHDLEKKTWNFLLARLQILLRVYPTDLEYDKKMLEQIAKLERGEIFQGSVKFSTKAKNIMQLRVAEKIILSDAIDYVNQRIKA